MLKLNTNSMKFLIFYFYISAYPTSKLNKSVINITLNDTEKVYWHYTSVIYFYLVIPKTVQNTAYLKAIINNAIKQYPMPAIKLTPDCDLFIKGKYFLISR